MAGQAGVNKFKNLAGHENAHATEQAPIGDIQTAKGTITNRNLYEWDAEKKGAAAEGKDSKSYHRDGQPADYKEAHDQGNDLEKVGVSSDELSNFLAKGDTEGLQKRVIEGEIKNGTLTPEQLEKNITVGQEKYTKAVADVLTADPKEVPAAMAA